jgi:hypothetical protein
MRMEERAAGIRAEIAALPGERGPGNRYPTELRERIVEYSSGRRKQGLSIVKISLELGIGIATLRSWTATKRAPSIKIPSAGFERLEVIDAPACSKAPRFVVRGPAGLCIEGLDIDTLAELIRRLS